MAENVEEKVVAAKFDASDFEKGVNKTIKKLDELEKKLDMKSTGEAIESISKKTKEASESASKSLENLSNRFTTFTGMLKQKLLSGLADQIVGVFFKLEQSMVRFAKSMTFDQISAGMAKYESALTSVRMIVNSYKTVQNDITGVQKKIHYTQDEAYGAINALQDYADETSYSMSQMTDAMSKMVSAGVSLDQAQKNVQGIANACAAAGVNATDAARAFYNLSQAYSSGSLKYTDYRSLQLLNMTNENFENQLIAAGVKAGTLEEKKDNKGNAYYVTKKSASNKKVTAGKKFTRSQASEYLKYGWAGTDVMDYLFGNKFFVDVDDFYAAKTAEKNGLVSDRKEYLAGLKDMEGIKKYIEGLADSDERKKQYKELASDEERTEYLTRLSEEAEKVTKITEQYKRIDTDALKTYLGELGETDERRSHYKSLKGEKERKEYLEGLSEDTEFLENYIKSLDESDERRKHYEELTTEPERQQYLKDLTADAQEVTEKTEKALGDYIMSLKETDERREKFKNMTEQEQKQYLKQLAAEATALGKIGRKYDDIAIEAFLAAREARNLNDVINAVADFVSSKWTKVFENLIGQLDDASDFFTQLAEGGIASLFMDFADWIATVSDTFNEGGAGSEAFRQVILRLDEALGNLFGIFNDLLPNASDFGTQMFELADTLSVAMRDFRDWTQRVRAWFTDVERAQKIQTIFANLSGVFTTVGKVVGIAFSTIGRALEVVSPVLNAVINALMQLTAPLGRLGSKETTEPFNKLSQAANNVLNPIDKLTKAAAPFIEKFGEILGIVGDFFLGAAIDTVTSNITFFSDTLGMFLEILGIGSAQQAAGEGVLESLARQAREFGEACQQAATAVGDFLKGLIKDLRVLLGLDVSDEGENKSIFANLQNFFETNEFIQNAKGWFAQAKVDIQNWVEQAVKDVQTWFAELPEKVNSALMRLFYEPLPEGNLAGDSAQLVETPLKVWLNGAIKAVGDFVAELPKNILNAFGTAFDFFGTLIDIVFSGNQNGEKKAEDKAQTQGSAAAEAVQRWIDDFLQKLKFEIRMLPIRIKLFFTIQKGKARKAFQTIKEWFNTNETGKAIKEWAASVVNGIKDFIVNLPETIKNLIKGIGEFGRNIIATVKETFSGKKVGEEIEEGFKGISLTGILSTIADIGSTIMNQFISLFTGTDDVDANIQAFIDTVVRFITSIPERLGQVVTDIGQKIGRVFDYIVDAFNGTDDMSETNKDFAERHPVITGLIDSAVTWIQGLPGILNAAWDSVKTELSKFWSGLSSYLSGDSIQKEINSLETIISSADSMSGRTIDVDPEELNRMQKRLAELKGTESAQFEAQHPFLANLIKNISDWLTNLPRRINELWTTNKEKIITSFTGFWDKIIAVFNGESIEAEGDAIDSESVGTKLQNKIIEIFANLPHYIAEGIRIAIDAISAAFEGLTNLLSGANAEEILNADSLVEAVGENGKSAIEQLDTAIEETVKDSTETVGDAVKKGTDEANADSPKNKFLESIIGIGRSFFNVITVTIPEFIKTGFKYVRDHWDEWKQSMLDVFTGVTGIKPEDFDLENIGAAIVDAIKRLPEIISNAWKEVSGFMTRLLTGDQNGKPLKELPKQIVDILEDPMTSQQVKDNIVRDFDKQGYNIRAYAKQSTIWDTIEGISTDIATFINQIFESDAFSGIGSFFMNLWKNMLEGINKFFSMLGQWFSSGIRKSDSNEMNADGLSDAIEKNYGVSITDELGQALQSLGTSIFNLFTTTIPEFLGKAIGTVINEIPNIVNNFLGGLRSVLGNKIEEGTPGLTEELAGTAEASILGTGKSKKQALLDKLLEEKGGQQALLGSANKDKLESYLKAYYGDDEETIDFIMYWTADEEEKQRINMERTKQGLDEFSVNYLNNLDEFTKLILNVLDPESKDTYWVLSAEKIEAAGKNAKGSAAKVREALGENGLASYTDLIEDFAKETPSQQVLATGEKALQQTGNIIETLLGVIFNIDENGKISGLSNTTWIVGSIALLGLVVEKLSTFITTIKDMAHPFTSTTKAEILQSKNSMEGVLKLAMGTLIVGMAFATVASQMSTDQFDQAMTAFDKVAELVQKITTIYGVVQGAKLVNGVIDTVANIVAIAQGKAINVTNVKNGSSIGGGIAGSLLGSTLAFVISDLTSSFDDIGAAISTFATRFKEATATIIEIAPDIDTVITAFNRIKELMQVCSEIAGYESTVQLAASVLNTIMGPIGLFAELTTVSAFQKSTATDLVKGLDDLMGLTQKMKEFAVWAHSSDSMFAEFKYAIASLGSAMSLFSVSDTTAWNRIDDSFIKSAVNFIKAIVGDGELIGLAEKMDPEKFGTDIIGMQESSEMLVIFAAALAKLASAVSVIDDPDKAGEQINNFFEAISKIKPEKFGGTEELAGNMVTLGSGLEAFARGSSGLTSDNLELASRALSLLSHISDEVQGFKVGFLESLVSGGGDIELFGNAISNLGLNLAEFFNYLDPNSGKEEKISNYFLDNKERLSAILAILNQLTTMVFATGNKSLDWIISAFDDGKTLGEQINRFVTELANVTLSDDQITKASRIVQMVRNLFLGMGQIDDILIYYNNIKEFSKNLFNIDESGMFGKIFTVIRNVSNKIGDYNDSQEMIENRLKNAKQLFEIVSDLIQSIAATFTDNPSTDFSYLSKSMNEVLTYMNENFEQFENVFNKADNIGIEKLEKAKMLFEGLQSLATAMALFSTRTYSFGAETAGEGLYKLYAMDFDMLEKVIGNFVTAYSNALKDTETAEEIKSAGYSMATLLAQGIQSAFDTEDAIFHPTITPVLNDSTFRSQIASLFGLNADGSAQINLSAGFAESVRQAFGGSETFTSLNDNVVGINGKLDTLKDIDGKVGSLQDEMTKVKEAIGSMKVYLDGDALVGRIASRITNQQDIYAEQFNYHVTIP